MSQDRQQPKLEFSATEIAALKAHPHFYAACWQATVGAINVYRGNRLFNTLVNERGRSAMILLALFLDRGRRPDDPRSGLTMSRLKAACAEQNICSPGRVEAYVAMMRLFGLLRQEPSAADQRVRHLVPTERLVTTVHERWYIVLAAMAMIAPEAETIRAAFADAAFERVIVRRLGEYFLAGFRPLADVTAQRLFGDRNAGLMIAFSLTTAGGPDNFPARAPLAISISALARQFGVSRVHVRKLLRDAAAAGYIAWADGAQSRIVVLPPLQTAVETFFVNACLSMRRGAQEALDEVGAACAAAPVAS